MLLKVVERNFIMDELINHIKSNGIDSLENDLGIVVKRYTDRIVLNYDQIRSPKHHPFVKKCRGLILSNPGYKVLSVGFDRFFNYGEDQNSKSFDIANAVAYEKVDGSYISVYNDGASWIASTRGTAFAESQVKDFRMSFSLLFKSALGASPTEIFNGIDRDLVFVFELVSPYNRVVTKYTDSAIYPLMVKNRVTMQEFWQPEHIRMVADHARFSRSSIKVLSNYQFHSIEEIISNMPNLKAEDEGYVCVSDQISSEMAPWRLKIKNPSYLALAHLRGNGGILSAKSIIQLVVTREVDEYLSYFSEDYGILRPYLDAYEYIKEEVEKLYSVTANMTDKDKGLSYKNHPLVSFIFAHRKYHKEFGEHMLSLSVDNRQKMFEYFMNKGK